MSRGLLSRGGFAVAAATVVLAATLGAALAQQPGSEPKSADPPETPAAKANPKPKPNAKTAPRGRVVGKGGLRTGVAVPPKAAPGQADAFAPAAAGNAGAAAANNNAPAAAPGARPEWPFHYRFKITGADGVPLAATFFPSRAADRAPVVVLVHQTGTGHSSRDFERPIEGLKNETLAAHLQSLDYAVLLLDLRGHGGTARRELAAAEADSPRRWLTLAGDLNTAYSFLIDRHNRREINLGMLGVVGVGDGASLATVWAASPGAAASNPGRNSDLGALVMVCPPPEVPGLRVAPSLANIAPRLPILLIATNRDADVTKSIQPVIERNARSRVTPFDTALAGDQLLRFEPKAVEAMTKFLDENVKFRKNVDWEPRYLLQPIAITETKLIAGNTPPDAAKLKDPLQPQPKAAAEAPKAEAPKAEAPKAEAPKAEAPKAEAAP